MGKKTKFGKNRLDKFYHLAKEQGYRSRAAFKLIQLNKKYEFLGSARACLDLCAAPGGWLQVARKYMPVQSVIVGVDLAPIRPITNVITMQEDITSSKCRSELRKHFKSQETDIVLHDGAPNVGTAWVHDAFGQVELTLMALKLAVEFLAPGGTFVTKVFRSQDYNSLLWVFNQLFRKVEATKPSASRNTSAEIFVVCQGFKAPKKIDPRLLDSKFVFKELDPQNAPRAEDIFSSKTGHKRHRTGYEEGDYTLFKKISVAEFVEGDVDPINALATHNQISWEDDAVAEKYKSFKKDTTTEVLACCDDLKVLGKSDFKRLLNWRLKLRTKLREAAGIKDEQVEEEEEVKDLEEEISDELDEKITQLDARKKKKERKGKEKLARYRQRVALQMEVKGTEEDRLDDDPFLFKLKAANPALGALNSDGAPDPTQLSDDDIDLSYGLQHKEDQERASDEESGDYGRRLENYFEESYAAYKDAVSKRKPREKIGKKKKRIDEEKEEERVEVNLPKVLLPKPKLGGDDEDDASEAEDANDGSDDEDLSPAESSEEQDDEEEEVEPIERRSEARPLTGKAARFFDQDLFHNMSDLLEADADMDAPKQKKKPTEEKDAGTNTTMTKKRRADAANAFEVVPKDAPKGSDDEDGDEAGDSESTMDSEDEAQARVLGRSFLRRKSKQDLIDDSYNRYAWVDPDGVPTWFAEDEGKHNKPNIPVTKAQADELRMLQKEIDARPIKKVAEAKARKKMRTEKNMEKLKKKAGTISNNPDLTEKAKQRALEKLYKGAEKKKVTNPQYVVARKGGGQTLAKKKKGQKSNGQQRMVDTRQKKDKRAMKIGKAAPKGGKAGPQKKKKTAKGKQSRSGGR